MSELPFGGRPPRISSSWGTLPQGLRLGTCSWKYNDWRGMLYSEEKKPNHLAEYAGTLDSVEIDQWFWSLHGPGKVTLPRDDVVRGYREAVPDDFRFTVKAPNSVSLSHYYRKSKSEPLEMNPHFLSGELFDQFLSKLDPLGETLGPVMLQFEYLNRQKMPSQHLFREALAVFAREFGARCQLALEIRNPNYLTAEYFEFLQENNLSHVFCQGYYMPSIVKVYSAQRDRLAGPVVIRLMGPDRKDIEKKAGNRWDRIIDPRDDELTTIGEMVHDLLSRNIPVYVNVNNHFEGSAPLTISRLRETMGV